MAGQGIISKLMRDPRHFQILTLLSLVGLQMHLADFGPSLGVIVLAIGGCLFFQILFSRIFSVRLDLRSPLISGLSLSILLKSSLLLTYPLAALIAVGSKFLIRYRGKHVFNPTNLAIVALTLAMPAYAWISPGQWGQAVWLIFFLGCAALLVLYQIPRWDMGPMFLAIWAVLLFGRALWLGDPIAIPVHQIQSGALLIFCFFMISDPKTIPDRFTGRLIFGMMVALIAYYIQFGLYRTDGLLISLALVSVFTPLIDLLLPGSGYNWGDRIQRHTAAKETPICALPTP
ncbi:MAG: RnfABCDGE type electron transport complex subunit D [Rhodospirillales bacterium]|nr:RnfABCDGE type electron transport complex subunit D [Alphaproteobacteria bacterium]MCB1839861.1 RnfABCDGE type electron transport complex subunit D [Alphaproteobacteria bacterium]MCB9976473.1 RnfABCDGE type electron transport complex subunit D [Rhodospirillales bacterium]